MQHIPVQTGANCALFAIVSAARFLGCDATTEATLIRQLDRLQKADPRTFIGEVLSIDLLLDLIRGVIVNDTPLFSARPVAVSTPAELRAIIWEATRLGHALLVPFARPQSYDRYDRLLGQQAAGSAAAADLEAARIAKDTESAFHPADAHWALVNRVDEAGQIVLADSFEDVWGGGHGCEATFTLEKLAAANLALDGCFDWGRLLDARGRAWGMHDLRGKAYAPSTPGHKNPARLEAILGNGRQESLDLAGRVVVMERNA